MSPQQFKKIRETFELTQNDFALCLGLTQKTVSQYEIGFRTPGPTVQVIVQALDSMSVIHAKKLLQLMKNIADQQKKDKLRRVLN